MKNQYVGDAGDYGKYGLLRFLTDKGIEIGVNWYLTPNDGSNDGNKIGYLKNDKDRIHDEVLFDYLASIVDKEDKSVLMIDKDGIIPNTCFYNEIVSKTNRSLWHENALKALQDAELIFCDPDNGPIGTKGIGSKDVDKYIMPKEIMDYYNRGQNIVYYCQKARRKEDAWLATKTEMQQYLPDAKIYVLTYHRGSQRSYIFVIHPNAYKRYCNILYDFERTSWGDKRLFTKENVSDNTMAKEKFGNAMKIKLDDNETIVIRNCDDGWIEVSSSKAPGTTIRRKAEHFVSRIR